MRTMRPFRNYILLVVSMFLFLSAFGQVAKTEKNRNYFLLKSKNQKTTAEILLGTGTAAVLIGTLVAEDRDASLSEYAYGRIMAGAGGVLLVMSVPYFISASKNKERGKLSIGNLKSFVPDQGLVRVKFVPAVYLKIII